MAKKLTLWLAMCLQLLIFAACSQEETIQDKDVQFPALEEIGAEQVWTAQEISYVASTGQEFSVHDLLMAGANLGLTMEISGSTFKEHFRSNAEANRWATRLYSYTFDRETGNLYVSGQEQPFAQIISYDLAAQEIVLHCHYDSYIVKGMLPGYDEYDTTPDVGSYARMVMKPETDMASLEEIATTDLIYDYRK